jgi:hypothetical protein
MHGFCLKSKLGIEEVEEAGHQEALNMAEE